MSIDSQNTRSQHNRHGHDSSRNSDCASRFKIAGCKTCGRSDFHHLRAQTACFAQRSQLNEAVMINGTKNAYGVRYVEKRPHLRRKGATDCPP